MRIIVLVFITLLYGCATPQPAWRYLGEPWHLRDGIWHSPAIADESMLVSSRTYGDFNLKLEFFPDHTINSGVFVRCQDPASITPMNCYEVNIWDHHPRQEFRTGAVVMRFSPPLEHVDTVGRWNRLTISAVNDLIEVRVNDVLTASYRNNELQSGYIALQRNGEGEIRFRNIVIESVEGGG